MHKKNGTFFSRYENVTGQQSNRARCLAFLALDLQGCSRICKYCNREQSSDKKSSPLPRGFDNRPSLLRG